MAIEFHNAAASVVFVCMESTSLETTRMKAEPVNPGFGLKRMALLPQTLDKRQLVEGDFQGRESCT